MQNLRYILFSTFLIVGLYACHPTKPATETRVITEDADGLRSIFIHGDTLHYVEQGSGEPLIFIHGTLGDYRSWIPWVHAYSTNYHAVSYSRRYAFPNAQTPDPEADYSVRIHARDLYTFIQTLGFEKVHLVGHSYGAYTALTLALQHPEIIGSLVLGEPPGSSLLENSPEGLSSFREFREKYIAPAGEAFKNNENEQGIETFLKGVMGEDFSWEGASEVSRHRWKSNIPEVRGITTGNWIWPTDTTEVAKLEVPVLLLMGDRSPVWFGEISRVLHRLLPQSELVTIDSSSHGLYFENSGACDQAIREFYHKHRRP